MKNIINIYKDFDIAVKGGMSDDLFLKHKCKKKVDDELDWYEITYYLLDEGIYKEQATYNDYAKFRCKCGKENGIMRSKSSIKEDLCEYSDWLDLTNYEKLKKVKK